MPRVQKYHHDNGDANVLASAWKSWPADVTNDLSHGSLGRSAQGQRSPQKPAPSLAAAGVTSQPCAHLSRHDDESRGVLPGSSVPSATDSECRLSSPTTHFPSTYYVSRVADQ